MKTNRHRPKGFTFVELLAIIALLGLGALVLTPALAKVKPNSQTFQCLNNARQLAMAFAMYTAENHDYYPPNPDDGNNIPGYNWVPGSVSSGEPIPPGTGGSPDMTNPDNLSDPLKCLVSRYLTNRANFFRCPADPRYGPYNGSNPALRGMIVPAVRSIALNAGIGTIDPGFASGMGHSGKPTLPVKGPWLSGSHGSAHPYATFGKSTDFGLAKPSQIFLTLDEDPWSINDGGFQVSAGTPEWIDFPAVWHNHGCTFSFCDGHVELHRWIGTTLGLAGMPTIKPVRPNDPDWIWVVNHATVKLQ